MTIWTKQKKFTGIFVNNKTKNYRASLDIKSILVISGNDMTHETDESFLKTVLDLSWNKHLAPLSRQRTI